MGHPSCIAPPDKSLPVRGAWIEIVDFVTGRVLRESLPVRGAWIEIVDFVTVRVLRESLPVRGAWIEMPGTRLDLKTF